MNGSSGSSWLRWSRRAGWLVRCAALAAGIVLLLPRTRAWGLAYVVPAVSPLVAMAATVSTRSLGWIALPGLLMTAVVLLRRRWFCRWACPAGLLADWATWLGRRTGRRCPRLWPVGQWLALVTLGGALLGYPMFLWLDPLALFSSSLTLVAGVCSAVAWLSVSGMALLLAASVIWPGVWCRHMCPLGGTQDLLGRASRFVRRRVGQHDRPSTETKKPGMSRRFALGTMVGIGWACVARRVIGGKRRVLRPPGALEETSFVGVCVRCGNCSRACPTKIIGPDIESPSVAALLAPVVEFQGDYCREDCTRCMDVCPSGALQRVAVQDKVRATMGVARVDMDICLLAEERECSACRNNCPFEAIRYVWSDVEYMLKVRIDPARCPGCGACQVACPTQPRKAIVVVPAIRREGGTGTGTVSLAASEKQATYRREIEICDAP